MEYLALLVPAMTLAGLPLMLIDRLERWAVSVDLLVAPVAPVTPDDAGPSTPTGSGGLG